MRAVSRFPIHSTPQRAQQRMQHESAEISAPCSLFPEPTGFTKRGESVGLDLRRREEHDRVRQHFRRLILQQRDHELGDHLVELRVLAQVPLVLHPDDVELLVDALVRAHCVRYSLQTIANRPNFTLYISTF